MIRLVIEVDDHPSWAECTCEAVATLLSELGRVRVVDVQVDKPEQMRMEPHSPMPVQPLHQVCPKCGERVISTLGPEGVPVLRDIRPRAVWLPEGGGTVWVQLVDERWALGELEGDLQAEHTVGFGVHRCGEPPLQAAARPAPP